MTQELKTGAKREPCAQPPKPRFRTWAYTEHIAPDLMPTLPANVWIQPDLHAPVTGQNLPTSREDLEALVEDVVRRLASDGQERAERAVPSAVRDYVEHKLHDAFSGMPYVKSVSYTYECGEWAIIIVHERSDEPEAYLDLIAKICDITKDDQLMPVFEPWILHTSENGRGVPAGAKSVLTR